MSTIENKSIIRKYIEEVINTGNVSELEKYVSADYTEVFEGKRYPMGVKGAKEHIIGVRQTCPDLTLRIDQQIAEGDYVATSITARGTHSGVWLGIKPTGKVVTYTGVNVDRVVNGLIVEHGGAANLLGPLLEIGAVRIVSEGATD
jgi:predicted ester cyclase